MEIIQSTLLMFLAISIGTYIAFSKLLGISQDPREPPPVPGSIPYIGHVVGLLRNKFNYYIQLRYLIAFAHCIDAYIVPSHQCSLSIFTIAMPGQKIYVVTTSDLIQAIQKLPAAFAFPPIEAKFVSRVCGSSEEAHKIVMKNLNGDEGDWGLSIEVYAAIRAALSAGPGLDGMNRIMAQHIAMFLDDLVPSFGSPVRIKLAKWLRQTVTGATTHSVYGPRNPFKDLAVADAFW